ncbi:MAG TPA: hypothetical protein VFD84_12715 [Candidatus Binatia bacterium]|nr:hypothetical protein [Candidatus Binatia bacterium]
MAKSLNQAGELPPGCVNELDRCAKRSTCGRSGWVTCCRTNRSGRTHCYVKRDASLCKAPSGGTAVVGQCPSCCQACSAGSCEAPPTVACCVPSSVDGALLEQVDGLVCEELTSAECEQRGGIDEGPGVCQPETCHPPTTTSTTATTTSSTTVTTTTSTSATTETSTTTTTTTSTTGEPVCGNEIVEAGEECDPPVSLTCPNLGSPGGALWQCLPNCACPRD